MTDTAYKRDIYNSMSAEQTTESDFWAKERNTLGLIANKKQLRTSSLVTSTSYLPGSLSVYPTTGLVSTGGAGGPFTPASIKYTLSNTGGQTIDWTCTKTQSWITLSKSSGTLVAGATDTVTVSINVIADVLVADDYVDIISFVNTTNVIGTISVNASLTVSYRKIIFILSSWSHWWVLPNLNTYGLRPCDGWYVMGAGDNPASDEDLSHTQSALAAYKNLGYYALPGFNPFYGTAVPRNLTAWFLTATWQTVVDWMTAFGEPEFVIDFEPGWTDATPLPPGYIGGHRYPDMIYLPELTIAIQPLVNYLKSSGTKLHLIPGYNALYTFVAALLNDPGASYFTNNDESQYNYTTPTGDATMLAHQAQTYSLGFVGYRPGLYYRKIDDFTIQERLHQSDMSSVQWYYPNSVEARKIIGKKTLVPWVEANDLNPDTITFVANGLSIWTAATHTSIVSTVPGDETIYTSLKALVPTMNIISGIKTSTLLVDGFDSVSGWEAVASSVTLAAQYSGYNIVVLENETAIHNYIYNGYVMNWDNFREGIKNLPSNIDILWYPSSSHSVALMDLYVTLSRIVQEELGERVTFVDASTLATPDDVGSALSQMVIEKYETFATKIPIPMIYCEGGDPWWPPEDVPGAVALSRTDWGIVYPGYALWQEVAQIIADL